MLEFKHGPELYVVCSNLWHHCLLTWLTTWSGYAGVVLDKSFTLHFGRATTVSDASASAHRQPQARAHLALSGLE